MEHLFSNIIQALCKATSIITCYNDSCKLNLIFLRNHNTVAIFMTTVNEPPDYYRYSRPSYTILIIRLLD